MAGLFTDSGGLSQFPRPEIRVDLGLFKRPEVNNIDNADMISQVRSLYEVMPPLETVLGSNEGLEHARALGFAYRSSEHEAPIEMTAIVCPEKDGYTIVMANPFSMGGFLISPQIRCISIEKFLLTPKEVTGTAKQYSEICQDAALESYETPNVILGARLAVLEEAVKRFVLTSTKND